MWRGKKSAACLNLKRSRQVQPGEAVDMGAALWPGVLERYCWARGQGRSLEMLTTYEWLSG